MSLRSLIQELRAVVEDAGMSGGFTTMSAPPGGAPAMGAYMDGSFQLSYTGARCAGCGLAQNGYGGPCLGCGPDGPRPMQYVAGVAGVPVMMARWHTKAKRKKSKHKKK